MAQLERKAFLEKWKAKLSENDVIDFLEDTADSFPDKQLEQQVVDYESDDNPYKSKASEFEKKMKDIETKYINRFLGGGDDIKQDDSENSDIKQDNSDKGHKSKDEECAAFPDLDTTIFEIVD